MVILDLGLPDIDGKVVLQRLRAWSDMPIVILSARDREAEKIEALDLGADDFVNKPFGVGELLARLRAALRKHRPDHAAPSVIRVGRCVIDLGAHLVDAGRARRPAHPPRVSTSSHSSPERPGPS